MTLAFLVLVAFGQLREGVLASMPPVEGPELQRVFADEWTLWFDESTMPRAMQFGPNSDPTHVHDGFHRFNDIDRTTNPNIEYPWQDGGGFHRVPRSHVQIAKFFWHPQHKPILYYRSVRSSVYHRQLAWDWVFPIDSVVGEVVALRRDGHTYPFEIRALTREEDAWHPQVWRQYNSEAELADRIWELGYEDLANRVGNTESRKGTVPDTLHPRPAVTLAYEHALLPVLPEPLVAELLGQPLKEVFEPLSMTAGQTQVLPAGYLGSAVGMGRDDCMRCHNHVAKHANEFDRPGRDWYGYVRGSDRIFSFHPFARQSISTNGGDLPVSFSEALTRSGHIAPFTGQAGYTRLP